MALDAGCVAPHASGLARVPEDRYAARPMPDLFGDFVSFLACVLIMAVAQLIYATVGFGAGMFAVALMALVLPDLTGIVVVLLLLTFVTEVWVLARNWRWARIRLLGWLVPGMAAGLWLGTRVLVTTDTSLLKQLLGLMIMAAGLYFIVENRARRWNHPTGVTEASSPRRGVWISLPVGLLSGLLGGLFGTGGPPVIIYLRASRLDKSAFRSTILTYFFLMSLLRGWTYAGADLFTIDRAVAAGMLLPGSVVGIILGMIAHNHVSEHRFGQIVSILLVALGILLAAGAGR